MFSRPVLLSTQDPRSTSNAMSVEEHQQPPPPSFAVDPANFTDVPSIDLPYGFGIQSVDETLVPTPASILKYQKAPTTPFKKPDPAPPPGVLAKFKGVFVGPGFNTIFRPSGPYNRNLAAQNKDLSETKFVVLDKDALQTAGVPDDNILELNLTQESLSFSKPVGAVPNRGLEPQPDIVLLGVPYLQHVRDVTNPNTGRADDTGRDIHFEPGLFMHVPASIDPDFPASICRMASIPHGTTINALGKAPTTEKQGAPNIRPVSIVPTSTTNPNAPRPNFPSLKVDAVNSARLPQDLTKFCEQGTITEEILKDPNTILRKINKTLGDQILSTTTFIVETPSTQFSAKAGPGNIPFLAGTKDKQNANVTKMSAIFWVETVQYTIQVPDMRAGDTLTLTPTDLPPGSKLPQFQVKPDKALKAGSLKVTATQIQYSQTVVLTFGTLDWPHVSVASLVPYDPVPVESSLLDSLKLY